MKKMGGNYTDPKEDKCPLIPRLTFQTPVFLQGNFCNAVNERLVYNVTYQVESTRPCLSSQSQLHSKGSGVNVTTQSALPSVLDGSTVPKMTYLKGDIDPQNQLCQRVLSGRKRQRLKPIWFKPKRNLLHHLVETTTIGFQALLDPGIK